MPDENIINEIEDILFRVVTLGAQNEQSKIVPNLQVTDINPTGLADFVIVSDNRDGDNILARKVPSVIYAANDLVNVIFPEGGEAIAFQQGSGSANGNLWEIVPNTTTDIKYDKGQVGIGLAVPNAPLEVRGSTDLVRFSDASATGDPLVGWFQTTTRRSYIQHADINDEFRIASEYGDVSIFTDSAGTELRRLIVKDDGLVGIGLDAPSSRLDILGTSGAQLRLTFEDGVKFALFTLDTNHDLTIKPSSTGQIILQPTTDSTDFFQILDADGGTSVLNVDSTNERVGITTGSPNALLHAGVGSTSPVSASGDGVHIDNSLEPKVTMQETTNNAEMNVSMLAVGPGDSLGKIGTTNSWPFVFVINNSEVGRFDTSGNVGIGTTGPDARLDILDTSGAQLRLTFEDGVKFADFTLDTNHDLTIKPSSTGQVIFQPTTDSTDFFQILDADGGTSVLNVDSTNERVGVGIDTPGAAFEARGSGEMTRFSDASATGNPLVGWYQTTTRRSYLQHVDTDDEFRIVSQYGDVAIFTDTAGGGNRRLLVKDSGLVGVNSDGPAAQLHVDQNSVTGAIPVLRLDQDDVSEEMIQLESTIGVGNAIEAVGAKTLTVTHFVKLTITGGLTRYFEVGTIA